MKSPFLEAGRIINTHGVRGEMKLDSWLDDPCLFSELSTLTVDGKEYTIRSARTHGRFALVMLEGIHSIDDVLPLKNKVVLAKREEIPIPEDGHFLADLIGMKVIEDDTGAELGKVTDILEYPAQDIYVVQGETEHLIPDVPDFILSIDENEGCIHVHLLEGM